MVHLTSAYGTLVKARQCIKIVSARGLPALRVIECNYLLMEMLCQIFIWSAVKASTPLCPALQTLRCTGGAPFVLLSSLLEVRARRGLPPLQHLVIDGLSPRDRARFYEIFNSRVITFEAPEKAEVRSMALPAVCTEERHKYWQWT